MSSAHECAGRRVWPHCYASTSCSMGITCNQHTVMCMRLEITARLHSSFRCCYLHIRSRQHPTIMESEDSVPCSPIYISWVTWIQFTLVFCLLSIRSDIIPCMRLGIPISYVGDIDYNCLYCIFISHLLHCPIHLILLHFITLVVFGGQSIYHHPTVFHLPVAYLTLHSSGWWDGWWIEELIRIWKESTVLYSR